MNTIETKSGVIDATVEVLLQYAGRISEEFPAKASESGDIAEDFLRFDLEDLLGILERRGFTHLKSCRALVAHGKSDSAGNFWYVDRTSRDDAAPLLSVKDWIDRHDGKYDVLVIYSCNTAAVRLLSKSSLLVYARYGKFNSEDIKKARYDTKSNLLFQPPNLFAGKP